MHAEAAGPCGTQRPAPEGIGSLGHHAPALRLGEAVAAAARDTAAAPVR